MSGSIKERRRFNLILFSLLTSFGLTSMVADLIKAFTLDFQENMFQAFWSSLITLVFAMMLYVIAKGVKNGNKYIFFVDIPKPKTCLIFIAILFPGGILVFILYYFIVSTLILWVNLLPLSIITFEIGGLLTYELLNSCQCRKS
ncbi:MAG: hypothetical protein HWN66_13525 [Candidatus Helarchaeota archaeon]|nr:hypothetical protein [Candidatus Helarchaeota archaeon]